MGQSAVSESAEVRGDDVPLLRGSEIARASEELVIGMVGAVGAGVSTTAAKIKEILERQYDYEVEIIKISDIIRTNHHLANLPPPASSGSDRIIDLQKIGTELRSNFGEDYLISKAIDQIATKRKSEGGYNEETRLPQPISRRKATIIDSLKHQDETKLLRSVYGEVYWQFTVLAPETVRQKRLKHTGIDKDQIPSIFSRDEDDKDSHGQKVSKTAYLSDFFVRNDTDSNESLEYAISRFIEIIFNIRVRTPTRDESGMYAAVSASSKSACLSRQVGVSIYSPNGELVSVGWNDVPKPFGGLYSEDDGKGDLRCHAWLGGICHNDHRKDLLYETIIDKLISDSIISKETDRKSVQRSLSKTPIKSLIEYSRSVHAEMEAIVSVARKGGESVFGGILYTTTYPCHNCARHIVAAGIKKVVYIEPYSKSLATELHSDAISDAENSTDKVSFIQYEGVGPRLLLKLFRHGQERKEDGKVITVDKRSAKPVLPPPLDGFTTHEKRVIERLLAIESGGSAKAEGEANG